MKRLLFLFAFSTLLLASCNDDDENENPPGGGDPGQPGSGSISAIINGETISSENNVARELSYGDFMIRTEADGKNLKFILGEFIGNATYTLSNQNSSNYAEYYTELNSETIGFRSESGELTISDYDQANQTFNASFDISFSRIGNESITTTGEGSFSALSIFEMTQPNEGESSVFFNENEYFNTQDSLILFQGGTLKLVLDNGMNSDFRFEGFVPDNDINQFSFLINNEISTTEFSDSEILFYEVDTSAKTVSGHFKNFDTNEDLELRFNRLSYGIGMDDISFLAELTYGAESVSFETAKLREIEVLADQPNGFAYTFLAEAESFYFSFFMFQANLVDQGIDQTVQGVSNLIILGSNEFSNEPSQMSIEPGSIPGTVNINISIEGIGFLEGTSVPLTE